MDLLLLWLLVEQLSTPRIAAAVTAYLVAISFHYGLSRVWVFRGTRRDLGRGFLYFLLNAGIGLVITIGLFVGLTRWMELHYLLARLVASVVAGVVVFLLNAIFNFRQL